MKEILAYIALVIAIYGAALSTITAIKSRRKLSVKYDQGFILFEDKTMKTMTTFSVIEIINKSSIPIYIKQHGFELKRQPISISKIDNKLIKGAKPLALNQTLHDFVPLNVHAIQTVEEVDEIKPGQIVHSYFSLKELKKIYLKNPKAKIYAYCVEKTGRKFKTIVSKGLVLSSQEPV